MIMTSFKNPKLLFIFNRLECRTVELVTMGKNDQQNCKANFTAFTNNKIEEIIKGLASQEDV